MKPKGKRVGVERRIKLNQKKQIYVRRWDMAGVGGNYEWQTYPGATAQGNLTEQCTQDRNEPRPELTHLRTR